MQPSFEQVPSMLFEMQQKVNNIEQLLNRDAAHKITHDLIGVQEAAELLGLSPATVYTKVSHREIPFSKQGKKLYFSRNELIAYARSGRRLTKSEERTQVLKNSANAMVGAEL